MNNSILCSKSLARFRFGIRYVFAHNALQIARNAKEMEGPGEGFPSAQALPGGFLTLALLSSAALTLGFHRRQKAPRMTRPSQPREREWWICQRLSDLPNGFVWPTGRKSACFFLRASPQISLFEVGKEGRLAEESFPKPSRNGRRSSSS